MRKDLILPRMVLVGVALLLTIFQINYRLRDW
jgi:hypothetical protein